MEYREAGVAVGLSALVEGLGQAYNRQPVKAAVFSVLGLSLSTVSGLNTWLVRNVLGLKRARIGPEKVRPSLLVLWAATYGLNLADAWQSARRADQRSVSPGESSGSQTPLREAQAGEREDTSTDEAKGTAPDMQDTNERRQHLRMLLSELDWTGGATKDDLLAHLVGRDDVLRTMVNLYVAEGTYQDLDAVLAVIPTRAWQDAQGDSWHGPEGQYALEVPSHFQDGLTGQTDHDVQRAGGTRPPLATDDRGATTSGQA
jgi:hypothetical protein